MDCIASELELALPSYPMARRGCCVIATIKFGDHPPPFAVDLPARIKDYERALFRLGFDRQRINVLDDVSVSSLTAGLQRLAESADHGQADCLLIVLICQYGFLLVPPPGVVLTGSMHAQASNTPGWSYNGNSFGLRYGYGGNNDAELANNPLLDQLQLSQLFDMFRAEKCPGLAGKPKLFFIHSPREQLRLGHRWHPRRHHIGWMFGCNQRLTDRIALTRCPEVNLGPDFYILYSPLPFYAGAQVPNPPAELAGAFLAAAESCSQVEISELTLNFMAAVAKYGSAEVAMPKVISTLTGLVHFGAAGR